jgi:thiamine-phosphate pyrophosphorylase
MLDCRLYLITPPRLDDPAAFAKQLDIALGAGDVAALQLRLKDHSEREIAGLGRRLVDIAQARGVAVLMNDSPALAVELGCDGVHIGQDDTPYREARRMMGDKAMIGVTCHDSRDLAMTAAEEGADYVAFGAFFDTTTKAPKSRADLEILDIWQETMQTPCVAIGGITVDNCRPLVTAGADFLAVSAGIWAHRQGPAAAVQAFLGEIEEGLKARPVRPA